MIVCMSKRHEKIRRIIGAETEFPEELGDAGRALTTKTVFCLPIHSDIIVILPKRAARIPAIPLPMKTTPCPFDCSLRFFGAPSGIDVIHAAMRVLLIDRSRTRKHFYPLLLRERNDVKLNRVEIGGVDSHPVNQDSYGDDAVVEEASKSNRLLKIVPDFVEDCDTGLVLQHFLNGPCSRFFYFFLGNDTNVRRHSSYVNRDVLQAGA